LNLRPPGYDRLDLVLTTRNAGDLVRTPATGPHRVRDLSCCGVELAGSRPG